MKAEEFIDIYSTAQAVEDGVLVLLNPATTAEAGIKWPVYATRTVFDKYIAVPEGMERMQDEDGRLWDVCTMFKYSASKTDGAYLQFKVAVAIPRKSELLPNERHQRNSEVPSRLVLLKATIAAHDYNDPSPAIFIMLPSED